MTDNPATSALVNKPNLNETLLSWKGPSHPFKKRTKMFYQTILALTFLFVVIVFFLHEFLLIGVILSVAFVVYVISSMPPVEVEHTITPLGVEHAGHLFRWNELAAFWFEKKWDYTILIIQTRIPFPSQVRAVLTEESPKGKVEDIVGRYLFHIEKPPRTVVDRFSDWLGEKIPLEKETSS